MLNTRRLGTLSALVALLLVVLGCSKLTELANKSANSNTTEPKSTALSDREWKSYDIANTDITVELPGTPKDITPPLPPPYKPFFSAMHISSLDAKDFQSSYSELIPTGKKKWGIKDLADTTMVAMKRQLSDLTYTTETKSDTNARVSGAFTKAGKSYVVSGCVVYKKDDPARVWAVISLYPKDSTDGQTAAQRIIQSVVFKNSTENCK